MLHDLDEFEQVFRLYEATDKYSPDRLKSCIIQLTAAISPYSDYFSRISRELPERHCQEMMSAQ